MEKQQQILLTDEQMRAFIANGFLILRTNFSEAFHANLVEQLNEVYATEGNPGNNLLPRIRDLQRVFDHPVVTGALTSVLGPNYMMHAHRYGHCNASDKPGGWHKDSYWGYDRMRNHHPWWAMVMYFPQDTPVELGPTGILPGTHNHESRTFREDDHPGEAVASGKAGTFALIHYDIWHRSTANRLGLERYMLKFEFMRTQSPQAPSWDNRTRDWSEPAGLQAPVSRHDRMWEETWEWLSGRLGSLAETVSDSERESLLTTNQLESEFEPEALNSAYSLAGCGSEGINRLLDGLHHERVAVSRSCAYGLSVAGVRAVPGLTAALGSEREETLIHALFALGELRGLATEAVPQIVNLLSHTSVKVRQTAVEALGMIGSPAQACTAGLIRGLGDQAAQVRFTAGLSLARMGMAATEAVPQLALALEDDNRYVRAHAAEALHYINTEQAKDVLIRYLLDSRWCPTTTKDNAFFP
ncbi:HEAT repeat domain-containing protein [Paenibacillus daejeonensis]|uniref:HEAT repeat domain-containing protein n=1 Tax=Paenibacillus daejeonensis TaxID=135193 RepID=UPI000364CD5E|nr:HEAT repeat domain-containing protein [Paenibacillus daejeonensis]